jgi:hypothetical protein
MITMSSSPLMAPVDDRMPAILRHEGARDFLDPGRGWDFRPFDGPPIVTPCRSPPARPRDTGSKQVLF